MYHPQHYPPRSSTSTANQKGVFESLLNFHNIAPEVSSHLKNVYSLMAATLATCALGIYLTVKNIMYVNLGVAQVIAFGLVIYLAFSRYVPGESQRIGSLLLFGFLQGTQLSGLVKLALDVSPNSVLLAALTTTIVFVCFSGSALLSERRSYLYLGGFLYSSISYLVLISLFSLLFGFNNFNFYVQLYAGLFIFMLYIIYDTQMIVEKASYGEEARDYVKHSYELFIDFVAIFVRILILLIKDKKKDDN